MCKNSTWFNDGTYDFVEIYALKLSGFMGVNSAQAIIGKFQ